MQLVSEEFKILTRIWIYNFKVLCKLYILRPDIAICVTMGTVLLSLITAFIIFIGTGYLLHTVTCSFLYIGYYILLTAIVAAIITIKYQYIYTFE